LSEVIALLGSDAAEFLPTFSFFARPSDWVSEFAVRIFVKKSSDFNQKAPPS